MSLIDSYAWVAKSFVAEMDDVCPQDVELGGWFLSPAQHVIECVLLNAVLFATLFASKPHLHHDTAASSHRFKRSTLLKLCDKIGLLLSIATLCLVIYHKHTKERLPFLLQPCHVLNLLMIIVFMKPAGSRTGTLLFNVYLQCFFSPLLGMFAADRSCYKLRFELANWFAQHFLLIMFPVYCIATDRFHIIKGLRFFVFGFSIEALFHFVILVPASIASGMNLNYVLCPPSGLLSQFGAWYRVVMTLFSLVLAFVCRFGLLGSLIWLVRKAGGHVESQEKALGCEDEHERKMLEGKKGQ